MVFVDFEHISSLKQNKITIMLIVCLSIIFIRGEAHISNDIKSTNKYFLNKKKVKNNFFVYEKSMKSKIVHNWMWGYGQIKNWHRKGHFMKHRKLYYLYENMARIYKK